MLNSSSLSLRTNFYWTFISNVIYLASQWGILVVLARLGTLEMVGQFGLGLAITAPIFMLTNLNLSAVQATDVDRTTYQFADYFGLRLLTTVIAIVVISTIAYLGYRDRSWKIILLVGIAKSFESLSDVIHGLLQQNERMDRIAISKIAKGMLTLPAVATTMFLFHELDTAILVMICIWALVFFVYDLGSAYFVMGSIKEVYPRLRVNSLYQLFLISFPLGIVLMLTSFNTNIPRIMMERYFGEAALGIFTSLSYILVVGITVVSALGQTTSPRLAKYFVEDKVAYKNLLFKLILSGGVIGLLGVLFSLLLGKPTLNLLYGLEYSDYQPLLTWLMLSGVITYMSSFMGYGITAARIFNAQVWVNILSIITTVILSFLVIPILAHSGTLTYLPLILVASSSIRLVAYGLIIRHALREVV